MYFLKPILNQFPHMTHQPNQSLEPPLQDKKYFCKVLMVVTGLKRAKKHQHSQFFGMFFAIIKPITTTRHVMADV